MDISGYCAAEIAKLEQQAQQIEQQVMVLEHDLDLTKDNRSRVAGALAVLKTLTGKIKAEGGPDVPPAA